jgi:hypothetical protein
MTTGRTIDAADIAQLLKRLEERSLANASPPSLKRDCDLAARVIHVLLQLANVKSWPIEV